MKLKTALATSLIMVTSAAYSDNVPNYQLNENQEFTLSYQANLPLQYGFTMVKNIGNEGDGYGLKWSTIENGQTFFVSTTQFDETEIHSFGTQRKLVGELYSGYRVDVDTLQKSTTHQVFISHRY